MFGKLLLLFIVVPIVELMLFLTLGDAIGLGMTLLIILITAFIGASLTKSQGRQALARFQQATGQGRVPATEAIDGLMILLAGAVLLTPGFLTDAFGFALLFPPARTHITRFIGEQMKGKIKVVSPSFGQQATPTEARSKSKLDDGNVIDV